MKTRYKILTSLLAPITVMPAIFTAASCNKDRYANLAQMMFDNTMQEFYEICKIYRPTFGTEDIARHINDKVYAMDLACYDDWDVVKKHKKEWAPGTEHTSGNLLVKLEATTGCEDWPTIILQAHMDMVCDGFSGGIVVPVIEDGILHTKDWKTSLGADDGIGIATLLSIIKYRNYFNHGPIRCIFTADEEDGEGCAHWIQDSWIKGADYIINLDHENIDDVAVSCAGVQQCKCKIKFDIADTKQEPYKEYSHCYQLKVYGVNGGSSGFALENNPIFAIQLAFEMMDIMYNTKEAKERSIDYIINNIVTDETQSNGGGSISQNITIEVLSKLDPNNIEDDKVIDAMLVAAKNYVIKQRATHPSEIGLKTQFAQLQSFSDLGFTPTDSAKITQLFKDSKLFGEIKQPLTTTLTTCSNAGPIKVDQTNEGKMVLDFETFGRTSLEKVLGPEPKEGQALDGFMKYYSDLIQSHLGTQTEKDWITNIGWNPCWQETKSNFTDLYKSYAARNGKQIGDFRAMGWAETAEFVHKAEQLGETIQPTSIGPTIVDGHTKNGYCVVSSIKEMIERLIYGIEHLTK